jgi:hypothetical protein
MPEYAQQFAQVLVQKVVILKHSQHPYVGYQAYNKEYLSVLSLQLLEVDSRKIINNDGKSQYQYIHREENHVEITTGQQQVYPPKFIRKLKINYCDNDKEKQKLYRIK